LLKIRLCPLDIIFFGDALDLDYNFSEIRILLGDLLEEITPRLCDNIRRKGPRRMSFFGASCFLCLMSKRLGWGLSEVHLKAEWLTLCTRNENIGRINCRQGMFSVRDNMKMTLKDLLKMDFRGRSPFRSNSINAEIAERRREPLQARASRKNCDGYRKAVGLLTGEELLPGARDWIDSEELAKRMHVGIASIKRWKWQFRPNPDRALRIALSGESTGIMHGNHEFSIARIKVVLNKLNSFSEGKSSRRMTNVSAPTFCTPIWLLTREIGQSSGHYRPPLGPQLLIIRI
jgi:hypothetical protein